MLFAVNDIVNIYYYYNIYKNLGCGMKEYVKTLGSVDIHLVQRYMLAMCRKERKLRAVLSYLVATLRKCFSLLNRRSTRFLSLYSSSSYGRCTTRFALGGMTASAPICMAASMI